jgi:tellurite resistance protein TehA-like permease
MTKGMGFSITAWGYTFPTGALAAALMHYHASVPGLGTAVLANAGLALASAIVVFVGIRSIGTLPGIRAAAKS